MNSKKSNSSAENLLDLNKADDIAIGLLIVYLYYSSVHSIASSTISSFAKGVAEINLSEEKKIDCTFEGWDEEILSKINTFLASKIEGVIKVIKPNGLPLGQYYDVVLFINQLISIISKQLEVNGTILKASLDDIHKGN